MSDRWCQVATLGELQDGDAVGVHVEGRSIALYLVDGVVYATAGLCTHQAVRLCEGFLEGHEIECPLHQGRFDVRTGKALCAPLTQDLAVFPVRVEDDRVLVALPA